MVHRCCRFCGVEVEEAWEVGRAPQVETRSRDSCMQVVRSSKRRIPRFTAMDASISTLLSRVRAQRTSWKQSCPSKPFISQQDTLPKPSSTTAPFRESRCASPHPTMPSTPPPTPPAPSSTSAASPPPANPNISQKSEASPARNSPRTSN